MMDIDRKRWAGEEFQARRSTPVMKSRESTPSAPTTLAAVSSAPSNAAVSEVPILSFIMVAQITLFAINIK